MGEKKRHLHEISKLPHKKRAHGNYPGRRKKKIESQQHWGRKKERWDIGGKGKNSI